QGGRMQLYEYVLQADDESDLADVEAALAWLRSLPSGRWTGPEWVAGGLRIWPPDVGPREWTADEVNAWRPNMLALRSVAHRVKGRRSKRPYPRGDLDARRSDEVFRGYLAKLQVCDDAPAETDPDTVKQCLKSGQPLRAVLGRENGIRLLPT